MKKIREMFADARAALINDLAQELSSILVEFDSIFADLVRISGEYRRIIAQHNGIVTFTNGLAVPRRYDRHERARRNFDVLSVAALILSVVSVGLTIYYGRATTVWEFVLLTSLAVGLAVLWKYGSRTGAVTLFTLKPDRPNEARVRLAEAVCVGCFVVGFVAFLLANFGLIAGDDESFVTEYLLELLLIADAFLITSCGIASALADYFGWSRLKEAEFEMNRRRLHELGERKSHLSAQLAREIREFAKMPPDNRPIVTVPAQVKEAIEEVDPQATAVLSTFDDGPPTTSYQLPEAQDNKNIWQSPNDEEA